MNVLLALPLLLVGVVNPPASGEIPAGLVSFDVRLVDCDAVGWREEYQTKLQFGGHRAGCSAWVTKLETLSEMSRQFAVSPQAKVVIAPEVVAFLGTPAIIGTSVTRHFVVHAELTESTPAILGEAAGPRPIVVPVDDGAHIRLVGLPRPVGMVLQVEVMDTRIAAVHEVETSASIGEGDRANVRVQIPEVTHREMGGEWLLPSAHGLVLSLGVKSEHTNEGQPQIRERLLLISMEAADPSPEVHLADPGVRPVKQERISVAPPAPTPAFTQTFQEPHTPPIDAIQVPVQPGQIPSALAATPWGLLPIVPVEFVNPNAVEVLRAGNPEPMPLPTLPSRTLPPAIGTDGRLVDPRTDKDREAERTEFTPYVDGQPVPSPQVTLPPPTLPVDERDTVRTDLKTAKENQQTSQTPSITEPKRDVSAVTVRFSLNLARGLTVDVDLEKTPESAHQTANSGEPPVRR
ncbi:hypothetical protein [Tautonia rosea]|uniref:hypothetical protein n=1 Tax=Tautonia rosea TaxID=2728037 RepID=UPI001475B176|nr:hypothetical protein [Tautonia rosea]